MVIKTKRLVLRPIQIGDEKEIHEYAGDKDITMMYFLPNETFEETVEFVKKNVLEWESEEQTDYEFVILYEGRIIGGCDSDLSHSEDRSYATLGWIINKKYRNQGFASEAAAALLDFTFRNLGVDKVYAQCDIENLASFAVMQKIGMKCINDKGTRTYPKTGKTSGEYTCLISRDEWGRKMTVDYDLLGRLYDIDEFVGYTEEEISELTEGFDEIPESLRDFWRTCGNTEKLFAGSNDPWMNLAYRRKFSWMKKGTREYFFLLNENQGVYQVGVRRKDMGKDNPPVYVTEPIGNGEFREIGQAAPSITDFLMGMLLYEAALGGLPYFREDILWYEPEEIAEIGKILATYPYHVENWYSDRIDFYTLTGDEVLYIMKGDSPNGTYSAKTKEAYVKLDGLIGKYGAE